ncbi:Uncharacterized protein HZ326_22711 [Fusarium oxysporum f. sp. albedinis]|nr:hypothetical protein HZ326_25919 [Fusarium oxysporum f. sp. albedinis]KAJ0134231.1 Uncharacterized protein HZ326_22711 [Fusarium oxysporum f. sp. albedinis]
MLLSKLAVDLDNLVHQRTCRERSDRSGKSSNKSLHYCVACWELKRTERFLSVFASDFFILVSLIYIT